MFSLMARIRMCTEEAIVSGISCMVGSTVVSLAFVQCSTQVVIVARNKALYGLSPRH